MAPNTKIEASVAAGVGIKEGHRSRVVKEL